MEERVHVVFFFVVLQTGSDPPATVTCRINDPEVVASHAVEGGMRSSVPPL